MEDLIKSNQNINGGGLSTSVTGKYTSNRHELAKIEGKYTAGEAAKALRKQTGEKWCAKDLVDGYRRLHKRPPEWHHAGFYRPESGGKTMGRTYFFTADEVEELQARWYEVEALKRQEQEEIDRKKRRKVRGIYWTWDYDYGGNYGKRRNFKRLRVYHGNELEKPRNFTPCTKRVYDRALEKDGKAYYGWDEPSVNEFKGKAWKQELEQRRRAKEVEEQVKREQEDAKKDMEKERQQIMKDAKAFIRKGEYNGAGEQRKIKDALKRLDDLKEAGNKQEWHDLANRLVQQASKGKASGQDWKDVYGMIRKAIA